SDEDSIDSFFTQELLEKVPQAVSRAASLGQMSLERVPDKELRHYFGEAHSCFLYGLNVACAVLCRAILESALESTCDPTQILKRKVPSNEYFETLVDEAARGGLLDPADDHPGCAIKVRH